MNDGNFFLEYIFMSLVKQLEFLQAADQTVFLELLFSVAAMILIKSV